MRRSVAFVALSVSFSLLASAEVPPSTSVGSPQRGHLVAGIHGHGSHTSGRDVDIRYYALDEGGEPRSEPNVDFGRNGRASDGGRFDVERNWLFIRSALESELADVQYIFIYGPLERLLLEHAEANGASPELLQEAARKMMPPGGGSRVSPHADHMHIRILCTAEDEAEGCLNRNSRRRRR